MDVIIKHVWYGGRSDAFTIVPVGDIHIGAAACDEELLRATVARIASDPLARWIGMGDYCDFINRSDPRFTSASLAKWMTVADMGDIVAAQRDRFLNIIKPIAGKCLALIEGNHEAAIAKHYERNVYSEIVTATKRAGGFKDDDRLALGYTGWLDLRFHRGRGKRDTTTVRFNLHHGFGGGRLAGGKALNMQRWLWTHDADVVLFGHTHNMSIQSEVMEAITTDGTVIHRKRLGAICGSYLKPGAMGVTTYNEIRGYLPQGTDGIEIVVRPNIDKGDGKRYDDRLLQIRTA